MKTETTPRRWLQRFVRPLVELMLWVVLKFLNSPLPPKGNRTMADRVRWKIRVAILRVRAVIICALSSDQDSWPPARLLVLLLDPASAAAWPHLCLRQSSNLRRRFSVWLVRRANPAATPLLPLLLSVSPEMSAIVSGLKLRYLQTSKQDDVSYCGVKWPNDLAHT